MSSPLGPGSRERLRDTEISTEVARRGRQITGRIGEGGKRDPCARARPGSRAPFREDGGPARQGTCPGGAILTGWAVSERRSRSLDMASPDGDHVMRVVSDSGCGETIGVAGAGARVFMAMYGVGLLSMGR